MLEALYRSLLKLYPRPFQDEYGEAMLAVFREDHGAFRHFTDLFLSIPREWATERAEAGPDALRLPPEFAAQQAKNVKRNNQFIGVSAATLALALAMVLKWRAEPANLYLLYVAAYASLLHLARYLSRRYWSSFAVSMQDNALTIYTWHGQSRVRRETLSALVESPGRGLTISREGKHDVWIPAALNGYGRLREQLSEWHRIDIVPDNDGRILKI